MAKQNADKQSGGQKRRREDGGLTTGFIIIPAEIRRIPESIFSARGHEWYGYVFGFGANGCFESEPKQARKCGVSDRTIRSWSRVMERFGEMLRLNYKGNWGCVWALRNPEVRKLKYLEHNEIRVLNPSYVKDWSISQDRKWASAHTGNGLPARPEMGFQEHRKWVSGDYYKTKKLISAAEPLPADGQAQRLKEEELRLAERDTAIRAEFERRLPPRKHGDLKEAARRADVYEQVNPMVVELNKGGMSINGAVEKVYNENKKLIDGVQ